MRIYKNPDKIKNGQKLHPLGPHLELLDYYVSSVADMAGIGVQAIAWYKCRLTGETHVVHLNQYGMVYGGGRTSVFDLYHVPTTQEKK